MRLGVISLAAKGGFAIGNRGVGGDASIQESQRGGLGHVRHLKTVWDLLAEMGFAIALPILIS
jgi:hypothetical protein